MTTQVELSIAEVRAERRRRERQQSFAEEAAFLSGSLREFTKAAWPWVIPTERIDTWHIDTVCDHVQAAYEREIPRLLVTIMPGAAKSSIFSVIAPAWRWTHAAYEQILSSSHTDRLAIRDTRKSRMLMRTTWFQSRWGEQFGFSEDENLKGRYSSTLNGYRVATHVEGGTGERAGVLILDDPHNAQELLSPTKLAAGRTWWSETWVSRLNSSNQDPGVMMVIGQRISEADLIGMLLEGDPHGNRWTHLCLPARYEKKHPYGPYPPKVKLPSGRTIQGDIRKVEGELLAPDFVNEASLVDKQTDMTEQAKAAQYQQRPAPREGNLLKRADWRYYLRELSFWSDGIFGPGQVQALPKFTMILHSWDTSLWDRQHSDYAAGQAWGCVGADRYLLRLFHDRAGLNATVNAMDEMAQWALQLWPHVPQFVLIEKAANGPAAIEEMKKRVHGVTPVPAVGPKGVRAESASPALIGHNCYLPGEMNAELDGYTPSTPTEVQSFIEECAKFDPLVKDQKDDQVDAWSQMVNWAKLRGRQASIAGPPASIRI